MYACDLAWAAGFFDGEGCFSTAGRTPVATISQIGVESLDIFANTIGEGTIKGPYAKSSPTVRRKPPWVYYLYGPTHVESLLAALWPWLGSQKRAQGVRARPAFGPIESFPPFASLPRCEQLAWAAGFFDGEGCFSKCCNALNARITHTNPTLLRQFQNATGFGKVYGPYKQHRTSFGKKDVFVFTVSGFERVQALLALLWNNLGSAKRLKAMALLHDHLTYWKCGHRRGVPWKPKCPQCSKKTGPKPGSRREIQARPSP